MITKRKNLKKMMEEKKVSLGFMCNLAEPACVEIAGLMGFDFIRIDAEHACYDLATIQSLVRVADAYGMPTIVRISCPDTITAMLDFGVAGIMIPHVQNAQHAKEMVKLVKYAPLGFRGFCSNGRAHNYGLTPLSDYIEQAANETLLLAQIEDISGLEHMEEIIATDGVDLICTGLGDISQSLGIHGHTTDPRVVDTEFKIIDTARKCKKYSHLTAGTYEQALEYVSRGGAVITVKSDVMLMVAGAKQAMKELAPIREIPLI